MNEDAESYDEPRDFQLLNQVSAEQIEAVERNSEALMQHIAAARKNKEKDDVDVVSVRNSGFDEHKTTMNELTLKAALDIRSFVNVFKTALDHRDEVREQIDNTSIEFFDKSYAFEREAKKLEFLRSMGLTWKGVTEYNDLLKSLAVDFNELAEYVTRSSKPLCEAIGNNIIARKIGAIIAENIENFKTKCSPIMKKMKDIREMLGVGGAPTKPTQK